MHFFQVRIRSLRSGITIRLRVNLNSARTNTRQNREHFTEVRHTAMPDNLLVYAFTQRRSGICKFQFDIGVIIVNVKNSAMLRKCLKYFLRVPRILAL